MPYKSCDRNQSDPQKFLKMLIQSIPIQSMNWSNPCPTLVCSDERYFRLYGRVTFYYVVELALVISLNGEGETNAQLNYEHTLALKSPPTSFHDESCLELVFTAQSPLLIQLDCVTFNGTYIERPLFTSRQPLGLSSHKLRLALPATVNEYRHCTLEFQVRTITTGVLAAISSIEVLDVQCSSAQTSTGN